MGRVHRRHAPADQGHHRSQHEGAALLQVRLGHGGEVRQARTTRSATTTPRSRRRRRACRPSTACATSTAAARSGRASSRRSSSRSSCGRTTRSAPACSRRSAASTSEQLGDPERAMHYYESALAVDPDCLPANQALFEHYFDARRVGHARCRSRSALAQKAMRDGDPTTRREFYRKRGVVARHDRRPARAPPRASSSRSRSSRPTSTALDDARRRSRATQPDAYDFDATYRELEKLYKQARRRRPAARARPRRAGGDRRARRRSRQAAERCTPRRSSSRPTTSRSLSALVDLHADMRHWRHAVDAIEQFVDADAAVAADDRVAALMRQAEIHADGEMDPHARDHACCARCIQHRADAPGGVLPARAAALPARPLRRGARRDRSRDRARDRARAAAVAPRRSRATTTTRAASSTRAGDARGAALAVPPRDRVRPGLRAARARARARAPPTAGDQRQAETLLIDAAHAAMAQGGAARRGAAAARPRAHPARRPAIAPRRSRPTAASSTSSPTAPTDRVALAEIYADRRSCSARSPSSARCSTATSTTRPRTACSRRSTAAPARSSAPPACSPRSSCSASPRRPIAAPRAKARAMRADQPLRRAARRRSAPAPAARRRPRASRSARCSTRGRRGARRAVPAAVARREPGARRRRRRPRRSRSRSPTSARLYGVEAEIFVGEKVPGLRRGRPRSRAACVVIDRDAARRDRCRRAASCSAARSRRSAAATRSLLQLGAPPARASSARCCARCSCPRASAPARPTSSSRRCRKRRSEGARAPRRARPRRRHRARGSTACSRCAKRAGLLACDDFAAAIWMIARLSGENLAERTRRPSRSARCSAAPTWCASICPTTTTASARPAAAADQRRDAGQTGRPGSTGPRITTLAPQVRSTLPCVMAA